MIVVVLLLQIFMQIALSFCRCHIFFIVVVFMHIFKYNCECFSGISFEVEEFALAI